VCAGGRGEEAFRDSREANSRYTHHSKCTKSLVLQPGGPDNRHTPYKAYNMYNQDGERESIQK